jgi:hypothetical protein
MLLYIMYNQWNLLYHVLINLISIHVHIYTRINQINNKNKSFFEYKLQWMNYEKVRQIMEYEQDQYMVV